MNKIFQTFLFLASLSFVSCSSSDENEQIPFIIRILILVIAAVVAFAIVKVANVKERKEEKKRKQIEEERIRLLQKEKKEKETRMRERQSKLEEYNVQYGECTKAISNPSDLLVDYIRVYEKPSVIIINDEKYEFNEIIGYNLTDNSKVIKGELSSSTSTSNASAIGRAVVGAALGGVAGAVVGGTTAKQKTEYKQGEDKTIHDFTVNINVNRLSEPLVKLHVGKNEDLANEIAALINAIVVRNK